MATKTKRAKRSASPAGVRKPRKTATGRGATAESADSRTDPAVVTFLRELKHPLKKELDLVRDIILGVSPEIREGLKWNAPSFRTTDHFATFNLRAQDRLQLILHTGAKVKDTATTGLKIEDPSGLLEWLAKDRCLVTFKDGKDIQARRAALEAILRAWLEQLPS